MKLSIAAITTAFVASAFSSVSCKPTPHMQHGPTSAIVYLTGPNATVSGTVTFNQPDPYSATQIFANLTGLTEGKHGLHVHELGDLSNGKCIYLPHLSTYIDL